MKQRGKICTRRGVTLVELVVVMALVAIMSASVVSLCVTISGLCKSAENKYEGIEKMTLARQYVENWFRCYDIKGVRYIADSQGVLTIKYEDNYYSIRANLEEEKIEAEFPSDITKYPAFLSVTGIKKLYFTDVSGDGGLIKCIITYNDNYGDQQIFDFLLSRRTDDAQVTTVAPETVLSPETTAAP